jgi:urate oxidase
VHADPHHHELLDAAYGKAGIHVLVACPGGPAPDLVRDVTFDVRVAGALDASFRSGDNAAILPSDTLRRHILATAAAEPDAELASLCRLAASRLLAANPAFATVAIDARERVWDPIGAHTFTAAAGSPCAAPRTARCVAARGAVPILAGGVDGLPILLTRGSAFTGFLSDPLTVQTEARDRPLGGTLTARWTYLAGQTPPPGHSERTVAALIDALGDRPSNAVQEWVTAVGWALLDAVQVLGDVALRFDSIPIAPLPAELAGHGAARAYEPAGAPAGTTEVRVRRR